MGRRHQLDNLYFNSIAEGRMTSTQQIELGEEIKEVTSKPPAFVKCKKCGKTIRFFLTKNDKFIPINAETTAPEDTKYQQGVHITHFATCSDPANFRRPKVKS